MTNIKSVLLSIILIAACMACNEKTSSLQRLKVSENKRFLVTESGDPFFWLGDTGWRLFINLDREDALKYLEHRKQNGFTVIMAQVLPWVTEQDNAYGHTAFEGGDPRKPVEAYWEHVDFIINKTAELGMYMAILPSWARTYIEPDQGSKGEKLFTDKPELAYEYASWLGERYSHHSHIIWMLGGDSWGYQDDVYDAMARAITETYGDGDPDRVLICYHPKGGTYRPPATSTGEFYHDKSWLDFNMIQSGHRIGNRNFERIAEDYLRVPVKPTMESEPCYEQHPVRHSFENGAFQAWHLRRRGYWSMLAGGFGYSYGGNGIWQMSKPEDPGKETHFNYYWYEALEYEGGMQMKYLRALFESRPFLDPERIPDQSVLLTEEDTVDSHVQCGRASDYSYWILYSTNGSDFELDADKMRDREYLAWWYNPRDGQCYNPDSTPAEEPFSLKGSGAKYAIDPPGEPDWGNDWILVLDATDADYGKPGAKI